MCTEHALWAKPFAGVVKNYKGGIRYGPCPSRAYSIMEKINIYFPIPHLPHRMESEWLISVIFLMLTWTRKSESRQECSTLRWGNWGKFSERIICEDWVDLRQALRHVNVQVLTAGESHHQGEVRGKKRGRGGYQKLERDLEPSEWPPSSVGYEARSIPWPAGRQSRGWRTRLLTPLSLGCPAGASPWPNTIRSQRAKGTAEAAPDWQSLRTHNRMNKGSGKIWQGRHQPTELAEFRTTQVHRIMYVLYSEGNILVDRWRVGFNWQQNILALSH